MLTFRDLKLVKSMDSRLFLRRRRLLLLLPLLLRLLRLLRLLFLKEALEVVGAAMQRHCC